MTLVVPEAIRGYIAANNAHDADAMAACFDADARVQDEGASHAGLPAIRAWIADTQRKYRPELRPLDAKADGGAVEVTADVSGTFPGSPVRLRFRFALAGDRIAGLEVRP